MLSMLPKFELVPMSRYFMTFPKARRPARIPPCSTLEPSLGQQDVGRLARDVDGVRRGDAHVRGVKRRRIVDAVAHEADDVPALLEGEEDPRLLGGRRAREDGRALGDLGEGGVRHAVDFGAREHLARVEADATRRRGARPTRRRRVRTLTSTPSLRIASTVAFASGERRVREREEALEHEVALVGRRPRRRLAVHGSRSPPPGGACPRSPARAIQRAPALAVRRRRRAHSAQIPSGAPLVTSTRSSRRSATIDRRRRSKSNGISSSLRHPASSSSFVAAQDGGVERAADARLEAAVEARQGQRPRTRLAVRGRTSPRRASRRRSACRSCRCTGCRCCRGSGLPRGA